jgi:hypothetical protein
MNHTSSTHGSWLVLSAACLVCQAGCTSALTTAYLRDALWDLSEHASESGPEKDADGETDGSVEPRAVADPSPTADARGDAERRAAAIEEAVNRLSRLGALDDAAQTALIETLHSTQQEDWPVVIEEFSASLAATQAQPAAAAIVEQHVVAKAPVEATVAEAELAPPAPEPAAAQAEPAAPPEAAHAPEPAPVPEAAAAPAAEEWPALTVHNACFASRVQAWGVVDRFAADRFRPGQEVIVYFEIDGLSAGESPAGFTTCIDAVLKLVGPDGREVHAWSFEPIAETCRAQRRDYFARYVVRIPDSTPAGGCRVELSVADTLAGTAATTSLPLEVLAD